MKTFVTLSLAASLLLAVPSAALCASPTQVTVFDPAKVEFPESIAIDKCGNLYLSLSDIGTVRKVTPAGEQSDFAVLPDVDLLGLTFDHCGNLFAAARQGIWKVTPNGSATLFAPIPGHIFLNDLTFDHRGNLYVTDDFKVWKVDPQGNATVWAEDSLFQPKDVLDPFPWPVGVNGLAFSRDHKTLFVSNTSRGQILAIPVDHKGRAGAASVFAEDPLLYGADGIRVDDTGGLLVAVNFGQRIVRISPFRQVTTLAEGGILSSPTSLVLSQNCGTVSVFICNNDYFFGSATAPGLLCLDLPKYSHAGWPVLPPFWFAPGWFLLGHF